MRQTALILASLLLCACDGFDSHSTTRYQSDFHYSYALNPGGRVEVDNVNGEVEIVGWDRNQCEISGFKYASTAEMRDRIKIDIHQTGSEIEIRTIRPPGDSLGSLGARYTIRVPYKTELERVTSSNGSIHVAEIAGRADLKTSNGPVTVESLSGMLSAHTSNGAIRAEHVTAGMEASTSNGPITVHFADAVPAPAEFLKFETNNGRVEITMPMPPRSAMRVQTSNSGITLRLPSNTAAKIRMETSHGEVSSDFLAEGAHAEHHHGHQRLEETVGEGGPTIDLHTTNGSIRVVKM